MFLGTLREHYILLFSAAGVVALGFGFVGATIGAWFGSRRAQRSAALERQTASLDAAQLATVMQALDSIAVEVERISEAQRFTSRVLAERPGAVLPYQRPDAKSITPH
jgi:hypothetical protein